MERVIAYVDRFNLYFGMKQNGNETLWLDKQHLSQSLLKSNQQLIYNKYFTSRIRNNPAKEQRQKTYIEHWKHFLIAILFMDIISRTLNNVENAGIRILIPMKK